MGKLIDSHEVREGIQGMLVGEAIAFSISMSLWGVQVLPTNLTSIIYKDGQDYTNSLLTGATSAILSGSDYLIVTPIIEFTNGFALGEYILMVTFTSDKYPVGKFKLRILLQDNE